MYSSIYTPKCTTIAVCALQHRVQQYHATELETQQQFVQLNRLLNTYLLHVEDAHFENNRHPVAGCRCLPAATADSIVCAATLYLYIYTDSSNHISIRV